MDAENQLTYPEFCEALGEPILEPVPETHLQAATLSAFVFWIWLSLFDKDDPAGPFIAAAMAHSFAKVPDNYPRALGLANRACALRWKRKPRVAAVSTFKF